MIKLNKKFTNYLKLFSIFFIISILFVQLVDVNTLQAEEYRLVKGTLIIDSGKNTKDIEVLLSRAILGEGVIDKFTAVANQKGEFEFQEIVYTNNSIYTLVVMYNGLIHMKTLDLSEVNQIQTTLRIPQTTSDDSILTIPLISILILGNNDRKTELKFLEIIKIKNDSNYTYVPGSKPMERLRFSLPKKYQKLNVDSSLIDAQVIKVDSGFALNAYLHPGEHDIMYGYTLNYENQTIDLKKNFWYNTTKIRILVPENLSINLNNNVSVTETAEIGQKKYQVLTLEDFKKASSLEINLSGLPTPSIYENLENKFNQINFQYIPVSILIVLMFIIFFASYTRKKLMDSK